MDLPLTVSYFIIIIIINSMFLQRTFIFNKNFISGNNVLTQRSYSDARNFKLNNKSIKGLFPNVAGT